MNKQQMFESGVEIFITQFCDHDRDAYTRMMAQPHASYGDKDGYLIAIEAFYIQTGWLKKEERDPLFKEGVLPQFAIDVYRKLETQYFGIDLISHR